MEKEQLGFDDRGSAFLSNRFSVQLFFIFEEVFFQDARCRVFSDDVERALNRKIDLPIWQWVAYEAL